MLNFLQADQTIENLIVPDSIQKARFVETVKQLSALEVREIWSQILDWCIWTSMKLVIAVVIYYVARWLLRRVLGVVDVIMTRREVERSLHSFCLTAIKTVGYVFIIVIIISTLGFDVTIFVGMLASVGLAIGMALSGTLQNFAGGVMILLLRPYKIGDFIEANDVSGTVADIKLFTTIVHTSDKKTIYIPNNTISTSIINNYTTSTTRRCSWKVSVAYGDDYDVIRKTMLEIITRDERTLKEPMPIIRIDSLADSAVVIEARAWVKTDDFWGLYDSVTEAFYKELPEAGANFPVPQWDVHLKKE